MEPEGKGGSDTLGTAGSSILFFCMDRVILPVEPEAEGGSPFESEVTASTVRGSVLAEGRREAGGGSGGAATGEKLSRFIRP
jgi:hypothetical protein